MARRARVLRLVAGGEGERDPGALLQPAGHARGLGLPLVPPYRVKGVLVVQNLAPGQCQDFYFCTF